MSNREYMTGFGNFFESEALAGALPKVLSSPQRCPMGLYAEKLSGTAFTTPRAKNLRSWLYRILPSVAHAPFQPMDRGLIRHAVDPDVAPSPNQYRWQPISFPETPQDFIESLATIAINGAPASQTGLAIHIYRAERSMDRCYFYNADGEFLVVPELGGLHIRSEFGVLDVMPGEILIMPRGVRFAVDLTDNRARGYIAENFGAPLELPERGPIGSDGLANVRDFKAPVAAYEDYQGECELIAKYSGFLHRTVLDHSPLDVVAWHGNLCPFKYDLRDFNTIGSISYDHPDPSIFTVLTSQSDTAGVANLDFAIFPPRWLVMENTFRPPWFHRNVMSEYMGLVYGDYDAKKGGGFEPGGGSLHNVMSPHGPDRATFLEGSDADMAPEKLDNTMAFMFESRYVFQPTEFALSSDALDPDYQACWQGMPRNFNP